MRTKNLFISLSLFVIFMASSLLAAVNANSQIATPNNLSTQTVEGTQQQTDDITAYTVDSQSIVIGDQQVSSVWSSDPQFDVSEYKESTTQGYVKALHDSYYIYFLFAFPSDLKWVAMELDANSENCMQAGHDGWVFGTGTSSDLNYYGDVSFVGTNSHPVQDQRNDLTFEKVTDSASGLSFIEVRRALDTSDTAGKDLVFVDDSTFTVKFASSLPTAHTSGTRVVHTLGLTSEALNVTATNTIPSQTTTTRPIGEVKADHLDSILIWGSIGFFFNLILVNLLIFYGRRS
jgi:hypothetical protein